ncbi:MAG: hypothetical protein N2689_12120, partial [Verrucomicrobiae bacterium]|nr:hypothetical protein [Verrucomicrobiae bacterium]
KTLVWWDDYDAAPLLKWREMSPGEIRQAWLGLADFVLLRSLYMGGIPTPRLTVGVPKLMEALPMIHEIVRAGWQPAPAFQPAGARANDPGLWAARYGEGLGTFLTLGNATASNFSGEIEIDGRYLGDASHVFAPYGNGKLTQTVAGTSTRIPVNVGTRETLALKSVLALPARQRGRAMVGQTENHLRIELENAGETPAPRSSSAVSRLRVPADAKIASLAVNGHSLDFAEEPDAARFKLPLRASCVIEAVFESRWLASPPDAILGFDFEKAVILLGNSPAPQAREVAERLREYFRFASTEIMRRRQPLVLEIREGADAGEKRGAIMIQPGRTRVENGNLLVDPNPSAVRALLRLLDRKYFFAGRFPTTGENDDERALIQKSGLGGKILE